MTIRLPKIANFRGAFDLTNMCQLQTAGLPSISHTHTRGTMNITGQAKVSINNEPMNITTSGAFSSVGTASGNRGRDYEGYASIYTLDFDASKSWTGSTSTNSAIDSIYGATNTVKQESVNVFYFIRVK
jgi:hypothetical protein